MQWGKREIFQFRKRLEMSQHEFAEFLRTRQSTISDWESGVRIPSPMAQRLLSVLKELEELKAEATKKSE